MKVSNINVTLLDSSGSDLSVVNAARVSFAKESAEMTDKDEKLIKYLAEHRHKSPFNHAFMSFRVKAPIFVARQLVKHEYLPWNEVSRRYVTDEVEVYLPEYWRKKADNVKQGSSDDEVEYLTIVPMDAMRLSLSYYQKMIDDGVCAEQARMILPQNTMTEWIWSGTLYAFAKMCVLRLDSHTQKETREVAEQVSEFASKQFPLSWKYLVGHKHAV